MTTRVETRALAALENTKVADVMHRGVVSCPLETPLRTVARMMATHRVHCVVGVGDVAEDDTLLWGLVSDRDVLAAAAVGDIDECEAGSCVSTDLLTISPESPLHEAVRLMNQHGVSHLVVVQPGSDWPLGVVSTLDVAAVVGGVPTAGTPRRATRVDQLMTTPVATVTPDMSLKEAAALLVEREISGVPVVSSGEVVGVLSEANIVAVEQGASESGRRTRLAALFGGGIDTARMTTKTVGDAMSAPAITVAGWQSVASAASLMTRHAIKRLPVLDNGRLVGIVSRRDLVRTFARSDAEIKRDIREEVLSRVFWLMPEEVAVEVRDGEVTLSGSVTSEITEELLPDEVRKVPGVVSVESTFSPRG